MEANPNEVGTLYGNNDARYMTGAFSTRFGRSGDQGSMPTTPQTYRGSAGREPGNWLNGDMYARVGGDHEDKQMPLR